MNFALHSHYTGYTTYQVWFDFDNSLTRWERIIFKIRNSRNRKIPFEYPFFFLGKLSYANLFFLVYTLITLVILHTKFGLILTTQWPGEKELILKFAKIRNSRISQNSVWKPNFFLGKLYQK